MQEVDVLKALNGLSQTVTSQIGSVRTEISELRGVLSTRNAELSGRIERNLETGVRNTAAVGELDHKMDGLSRRVDDVESSQQQRKAWFTGVVATTSVVATVVVWILTNLAPLVI